MLEKSQNGDDVKRGQYQLFFFYFRPMGSIAPLCQNWLFWFWQKILSECWSKSENCHSTKTFGILDVTVIDFPYLYTYITCKFVCSFCIHLGTYTCKFVIEETHNMYMFSSGCYPIKVFKHIFWSKAYFWENYVFAQFYGVTQQLIRDDGSLCSSLTNLAGFCFSLSAPQTQTHKSCQTKKIDQFLLHFTTCIKRSLSWPTKQTCGGIFDRFCSRAASVK